MLGLTEIEATLPGGPPTSTYGKTVFLVTHLTKAHGPTSIVAFSSLAILVSIRMIKAFIHSSYPPSVSLPASSSSSSADSTPVPTTKHIPLILRILLPLPEIFLLLLLATLLSSLLTLSSPPYSIPVLGRITVSTHRVRLVEFPLKRANWKWVGKTGGTSV